MAQRVTRPGNVSAHPGIIDRNAPRRSREEMQVERELKAVTKAQVAKEKKANIDKIAALENAERQKVLRMDLEANDPMDPAVQAKVRRSRKRPVDNDEGPDETPTKKKKPVDATETPLEYTSSQYTEAVQLAVAKLDALLNESGTSGSEYNEGKGGSETEEETDCEGDLVDEDEEGEERTKGKKRGKKSKKEKKGHLTRDQIGAAVAAISDGLPQFGAAKNRVASTGSIGRAGRSQTPGNHSKTPFGLVPNWQTAPFTQPPAARLPASQPRGPTFIQDVDSDSDTNQPNIVTVSRSSTVQQDSLDPAASEPNDESIYHYGSFIPENEGLDQPDPEKSERMSSSMYKSITKIEEIHTPRLTSLNKPKKKRYITHDHLPPGTKDLFKKKVVPFALETAGALKPWENPNDTAIITIWNCVYNEDLHIDEGNIECDVFLVAKTLIKRAMSSWLHKFAETAERALLAEFTQCGLNTEEGRSAFVQRLLGSVEDVSCKKRPFLWQTAYDNPSERQEGIFQGRLVARTFLEHIQYVNVIDKNYCAENPPVGALILAIQAVHRALLYSVSGTSRLPSDKKSAEFSKTNWCDYTYLSPTGQEVSKKCTSTFLKTINNLKEQQWADIFKVATSFQTISKQPRAVKEEEGPRSETDTDEDDELVDPRYNDIPGKST